MAHGATHETNRKDGAQLCRTLMTMWGRSFLPPLTIVYKCVAGTKSGTSRGRILRCPGMVYRVGPGAVAPTIFGLGFPRPYDIIPSSFVLRVVVYREHGRNRRDTAGAYLHYFAPYPVRRRTGTAYIAILDDTVGGG